MSDNDRTQVDRREFLQAGGLAAASAAVIGSGAPGALAADEPSAILPTRKLGKTGIDVTILNIGTGAWRNSGATTANQLLRRVYAGGIRYIDTAKAYGTEPYVAKFFKDMPEARKDTFVVTKDTPKRPSEMVAMLDARLQTLQLDSVDMFFFHGLGDHHTTPECIEILKGKEFKEACDTIRKSGKAKFVGFSCHNKDKAEMLTVAAEMGVVDAIMVAYTPWAGKDHPINKALDACHAKGIGLISMKQLTGANKPEFLAGVAEHVPSLKDKGFTPYQMLLQAIWSDERIASCCVSMSQNSQITENVAAARAFKPLTVVQMEELKNLFLASSPTLCANCDGRCSVAAGTEARLGDIARFLTYHEEHGHRTDARREFAALTEAARDWAGADLAAAQAACPSNLNFSEILPKAGRLLA